MVSSVFPKTLKKILEGTLNFSSMSIKAALLDENYVFDPDTEFLDTGSEDASNPANQELIAVDSYVRKSVTLSFGNFSTGNGGTLISVPNILYGNLGGVTNVAISKVILFHDTGDDLTSPVIAVFEISVAGLTSGIPVIINSDASGQVIFQNPVQA